ncbi:MAG: hypothetical protein LBH63_02330 [Clostridiales Family XIII bacterium]|jgi:hypothetical protein|nr:hypothetical protein [Clostridiales Family XIII bacterium]
MKRIDAIDHPKRVTRRRIIAPIILAVVLMSASLLSSCGIRDLIASITQTYPTAENTLPDMLAVNDEIEKALEAGEEELTLNVAASEDEIKRVADNLDPFWGSPTKYSILGKFDEIALSDDKSAKKKTVLRIKFELKLSINYYAYQSMKNDEFEMPDDFPEAKAAADALPGIIDEIYGATGRGGGNSHYEKVLAAHDWIVGNLTYDETIDQTGMENGIYGALINRRTMCQGYAEALQLILRCATDVPVKTEIGEGHNGDGRWMGHAWNLVFMDDDWYQVDATFNDPIGNEDGTVDHTYFGQNDAMMRNDHKWNEEYRPAADGTDFLYYRKSGLYAESLSEFESIARSQIEGRNPDSIEIAVRGVEITDKDLQFLYKANKDIDTIYWRSMKINDAIIAHIEPEY